MRVVEFQDRPADCTELLLRLYRLSQELPIQDFQDAAFCQIKQVLPFDSAVWGTAATTTMGIDIHAVHLHQTSEEMLLAYEPLKHLDTAAASVFGKLRVTRVFHARSWFHSAATSALRDFLRRFGHENMFIASECTPGTSLIHWVSLFRADEKMHGTEEERLLLAWLSPHVMQALALNRVLHLKHFDGVEKALLPDGAAISDVRGWLHHADPRFRTLAQAEWNDWRGLRLPAELMACLQLGRERFIGRSMVIRAYVEHGLLFLKARPRCPADQLTPREHTIARRIAKGESHKQIAQALGRSPATVRNQIQTLYDKLQVGSIATLIEALRLAE